MLFDRSNTRMGHGFRSWPVLLLLLAVVLLPTVGVIWFMSQAMRNEQLAVRQKLRDVYDAQLQGLQRELQQHWQARTAALDVPSLEPGDPEGQAPRAFARLVRAGLADSVVIYDAAGRPVYPTMVRRRGFDPTPTTSAWRQAERLEREGQNAVAAQRYAVIARATVDADLGARALQAQARCLVKAEQTAEALAVLIHQLDQPRYQAAADAQGRLHVPNAQLRALQLLQNPGDPVFERVMQRLAGRLQNYGKPLLPAAQRRFLMQQLTELVQAELESREPVSQSLQELADFDTLEAEQLAAHYLDAKPSTPSTTGLQPTGLPEATNLPEIWHLASHSGSVVALFSPASLRRDFQSLAGLQRLPADATVELLPPGTLTEDELLVVQAAGSFLPGWRLALHPGDSLLFAEAAEQRIRAYRLIGALVVATLVLLLLLVVWAVERQLRLTRLKNDLLATVSHELKTPLASTRLLVDTLLETGVEDQKRVQEYLELIASENLRLSRLVDNFLTFSRMEQGRQSFDREWVPAALVAETAAAAMADRFRTEGCRFDVEIAPNLPAVRGDEDALVAVLLNLLDNALKYSQADRHICLRAFAEEGHVCFAVQDNGIGIPSRVTSKIFDRFYQVDQSLSRPGSGCGLGLSIVHYIISAHAGEVEVESRQGEGSTFTVRLPAALEGQTFGDTEC